MKLNKKDIPAHLLSYFRPAYTIKPKDDALIPHRVAVALQADGWYLRSDIIYAKTNPMPESVTDRPTKAHEYLFLLSKSARYFYDADAIKEPAKDKGIMPRGGKNNSRTEKAHKPDYWLTDSNRSVVGRNKRTVWTIATKPYAGAHFATYPPALVEPCIKAGTSERGVCPGCGGPWERVTEKSGGTIGKSWHPHSDDMGKGMSTYSGHSGGFGNAKDKDGKPYTVQTTDWRPTCGCCLEDGAALHPIPATVLDPFVGSGTTLLVARKLGRHGIGLDYSFPYLRDQARPRLSLDALDEWEEGRTVEEEAWRDTPLFQIVT